MLSLPLHLFPTNGLDRSLHAPVLIGLVLVTFFTEAFGWTYAGLVVPGYLAAAFAAAPVTACLILAEALLTHWAVLIVAQIIPRQTGAWSTAFGRERFFLYIVVAVIVRLGIEGSLVPWASERWPLSHNRELYSIGLVLVPLVANVFWSAGVLHSGPRLLALTGLTYLIVTHVLLGVTNYSLSRFEVANESGALHFLDTSKAYLLLLSGALLGARGNVRYGWDYNGILVPALLAVAWYQPVHVLGTAVEAVGIYLLARWLVTVPPWSRMALVGSRRMLFIGIVGFLVKLAAGHALAHWAPRVQITEYLGFGYILPSLLAVKMWNKSAVGIVLMPTLQVSLSAFLLGNALGFGLNWLGGAGSPTTPTAADLARVDSAAFELLLASTAPPPRPGECVPSVGAEQVLALVQQSLLSGELSPADVSRVSHDALRVSVDSRGWFVIQLRANASPVCESVPFAVNPKHARGGGNLLLRVADSSDSLTVSALALADATRAPLVLVDTRTETAPELEAGKRPWLRGSYPTLLLRQASDGEPLLRVHGAIPLGLDVAALEKRLGARIRVDWTGTAEVDAELIVSQALSDRLAAVLLGAPELEQWPGPLRRELSRRAEQLMAPAFAPPRAEELRVLSRVVVPALIQGDVPSPWVLAAADRLGYRIAAAGEAADASWILHELDRAQRRGQATWIVRRARSEPLAVEVPVPLWEVGTLSLGLALFDAEHARHLLLGGARPDAGIDGSSDPRRAAGKAGTFQRLHEELLARGMFAVAIHGADPDVALATDLVAEMDHPVLGPAQAPAWLSPKLASAAAEAGLTQAWYGASLEHVQLGAQFDPAFAFAARFAPGHMARLWFGARTRQRAPRLPPVEAPLAQLPLGTAPEADVAERAFELLACSGKNCPRPEACDLDAVVSRLEQWLGEHNPFDRIAALAAAKSCHLEIARDRRSGVPWALLGAGPHARLVPLHGAQVSARHSAPLHSLDSVRRAVDWGLATVFVEPP